jgi:mannosyltransferase OCH1-like enzyme
MEKEYNIISNYNKIPLKIFQTWETKKLPTYMKNVTDTIRRCNPEFEYFLYDDKDCEKFIEKNYSFDVLNAFNTLIPGAYKADLWRYCILYFYGGIYVDIKFKPINNYKFINLINKEYYVKDIKESFGGIYNGLIVSKQRNIKLLKCIDQIVSNTKLKFYGKSYLHVTGPKLFDQYFTDDEKNELEMQLVIIKDKHNILLEKNIILCEYKEYREEQIKMNKKGHYASLWNKRNIYMN